MDDLGVARHGLKEKASVAMGGIPFHAQQCRRLFSGEFEHLSRLANGLRTLQLTRLDALEVGVPARPCCRSAFGRRSECLQMDIFDVRFLEGDAQRRFRESGPARQG